MSAIPGILLLLVGLAISIALHELGHLIFAKAFGVKVSRYFVGFGPTLWSTKPGQTEYGIKAIPVGGFVAIAGMLAPAQPGTRTVDADGNLTAAETARQAAAAELEPGEEHQAFWRLPAGKKILVMFAGPFANFILAGLGLALSLSVIGQPVYLNQVGEILPDSPAASSELVIGDVIESWGGQPTANWEELRAAIAAGGAAPVTVVVQRGATQEEIILTPELTDRPAVQDGKPVLDDAGKSVLVPTPWVGIGPAQDRQQLALTQIPGKTGELALGTGKVLLRLPVYLWDVARSLLPGQAREAGIMGIWGVADMAGSISAAPSASYTVTDRAGDLLLLLAALNMSLFVFNLIPLLPLDGGHILGAVIEGVRRPIARRFGRPDPGAFDTARWLPLSQIVIAFLIAMTVLLIVADIVNPVSG
ncbi:MAG: site-2 protease family protein [Trueperella sp.]|nr:site-2 protease family protein [Trueperella sp.]